MLGTSGRLGVLYIAHGAVAVSLSLSQLPHRCWISVSPDPWWLPLTGVAGLRPIPSKIVFVKSGREKKESPIKSNLGQDLAKKKWEFNSPWPNFAYHI